VSRNAPNALGVFLELGPNLEASDEHGNTALHFAAARNRLDCARQLLKHGININRENMSGETALQIAVSAGHTEISEEIRMLSPASTEDEGNGSVV
jgi:ankyrin repeat protein